MKLQQSNTPFHFECSTVKNQPNSHVGWYCRVYKEHLHHKYDALFLLFTVCSPADIEINSVKFSLVWFNGMEENNWL